MEIIKKKTKGPLHVNKIKKASVIELRMKLTSSLKMMVKHTNFIFLLKERSNIVFIKVIDNSCPSTQFSVKCTCRVLAIKAMKDNIGGRQEK